MVGVKWLDSGVASGVEKRHRPVRYRHVLAILAIAAGACSNAASQLADSASAPTVAGATTERGSTSTTQAPVPTESTTTASSAVTAPPLVPTGIDVPILLFGDAIELIQPDGSASLIQRDRAIRVAGDTVGGLVFQRTLDAGPRSTILWQESPSAQTESVFIPTADQRAELHGVTDVTGVPEAVFSVTSPSSSTRSLNRIDLQSRVVTELRVVDDAEFGSKSTQVDGAFIVTTWERPSAAGWSVYQSGTGSEIGGSFPDDEARCAAGDGIDCARLASLSLNIEFVFRIVAHSTGAAPGSYDLLITRTDDGSEVSRIDLTPLEGTWYPEHLAELPDGRILLSRSVDPQRLQPMTGVVIDPTTGSIEPLVPTGFVRLP